MGSARSPGRTAYGVLRCCIGILWGYFTARKGIDKKSGIIRNKEMGSEQREELASGKRQKLAPMLNSINC